MKVLITGGAGYIGSMVVSELILHGHEPVILDTFNWGVINWAGNAKLIEGDCRNAKDIIYALDGVDAVIHLAGIVGEAACENNPKAHYTINIQSTMNLLACCVDNEVDLIKDLIYVSSCSVYGNVQGIYDRVTEETPTQPLSAYASAKLRSEHMVLSAGNAVHHFHPTILRLTTLFGWSFRPRLDLVTNLFTYEAWRNKKIKIHGDGSQYRSLIHVKDVATAIVKTLTSPRYLRSGKIFHIGDERNNVTVKQIAEAVLQRLPDTELELGASGKTDRRDYKIDCRRFRNTFGWEPTCDLDYGIMEMVRQFEKTDKDLNAFNWRNNQFNYK